MIRSEVPYKQKDYPKFLRNLWIIESGLYTNNSKPFPPANFLPAHLTDASWRGGVQAWCTENVVRTPHTLPTRGIELHLQSRRPEICTLSQSKKKICYDTLTANMHNLTCFDMLRRIIENANLLILKRFDAVFFFASRTPPFFPMMTILSWSGVAVPYRARHRPDYMF